MSCPAFIEKLHTEIGAKLRGAKSIAIVGRPKVGKTTLAKEIQRCDKKLKLVHTDDWIGKADFVAVPEMVIRDLQGLESRKKRYIVEGVQVARMLKYGLDLNWQPDIVIFLEANIACESHHRGLAKTVLNSMQAWLPKSEGVQRIDLKNEFRKGGE